MTDGGMIDKLVQKALSKRRHLIDRAIEARHKRRAERRNIRGSFDLAQTTHLNENHWAATDSLSADAATSSSVRKLLRNRSRYEIKNNSYARGMVLTKTNDAIGTGPRLQLLTDDSKLNRRVEAAFAEWSAAVGLAERLRTIDYAETGDGEGFLAIMANPTLPTEIKVDVLPIEAEQIASPWTGVSDPKNIDGILLDGYGRPIEYTVYTDHPGSTSATFTSETYKVLADFMVHIFRQDRPGQHRGIPHLTPALGLFAYLRRYTLATVTAAEAAADFAAVANSNAPPADEDNSETWFDEVELERGMMTILPDGYSLGQIKAEHPNATYSEFKRALLCEVARCLNMPYNIAAGDSSDYNYASGRMDHQTYFKSVRVHQAYLGRKCLDKIFRVWLREYLVAHPVRGMSAYPLPPHQWFWPGFEHVDPVKEARAEAIRLLNYTDTLSGIYAKKGQDWEEQIDQIHREKEHLEKLGLQFMPGAKNIDEPESEVQE